MQPNERLFLEVLINGSQALLNKRQIESIVSVGANSYEITMITGAKFSTTLAMGDVMFQMSYVPHTPSQTS